MKTLTYSEAVECVLHYSNVLSEKNFGNIDLLKDEYDKDRAIIYFRYLFRVYARSQKSAPKFGYIGVGTITFAEARVTEFQRRVYRALLKGN